MKQTYFYNYPNLPENKTVQVPSNNSNTNYLRMKLNNVYVICIMFLAVITLSCSKMNDLHQPYLDEGEIVYTARVDSVVPGIGKNRIQLEISVLSQRIKTVRVFWNDYQDSVDVAIDNKTGVFKKMLTNMTEKSYIFQLISFDQFGNKSLPVEIIGKVYGDVYESTLAARASKIVCSNAGLVLTFSPAPEGNIATAVTYTNIAGNLTSMNVPAADNSLVIADNKMDSEITLSSSYGAVNGIDMFKSSSYTFSGPYKFDVKDLSVINYSTQHSDGENAVINIISGRYDVRWHSRAGGSSYPHFATIDMGAERTITKFGVWRSIFDGGGDNRAPDRIQFLISSDNQNWTDLGIFPFNRLINGEQFFPLTSSVQARYFKFVAVSGPENNMVLGGINVYGFK
jgi:hypothetical protein